MSQGLGRNFPINTSAEIFWELQSSPFCCPSKVSAQRSAREIWEETVAFIQRNPALLSFWDRGPPPPEDRALAMLSTAARRSLISVLVSHTGEPWFWAVSSGPVRMKGWRCHQHTMPCNSGTREGSSYLPVPPGSHLQGCHWWDWPC